jgi:hypothetical protein
MCTVAVHTGNYDTTANSAAYNLFRCNAGLINNAESDSHFLSNRYIK